MTFSMGVLLPEDKNNFGQLKRKLAAERQVPTSPRLKVKETNYLYRWLSFDVIVIIVWGLTLPGARSGKRKEPERIAKRQIQKNVK